jgi:hypothetical protein
MYRLRHQECGAALMMINQGAARSSNRQAATGFRRALLGSLWRKRCVNRAIGAPPFVHYKADMKLNEKISVHKFFV